MPGVSAVDPVAQVGGAQQRGGRNQHGAQLHHREDRLPQLLLVAQHDDQPVAPAYPVRAQPVRHLVRAPGQVGEGQPVLGTILLDDPQRRRVVALGNDVEPVQRPVELGQLGPAEVAVRGGVVLAGLQQEIPGRTESVIHGSSLPGHPRTEFRGPKV